MMIDLGQRAEPYEIALSYGLSVTSKPLIKAGMAAKQAIARHAAEADQEAGPGVHGTRAAARWLPEVSGVTTSGQDRGQQAASTMFFPRGERGGFTIGTGGGTVVAGPHVVLKRAGLPTGLVETRAATPTDKRDGSTDRISPEQ